MKIQDQVCTLEQAKKLKELDVIQKSVFFWYEDEKLNGHVWSAGMMLSSTENNYYAFSVAELGIMLPKDFKFLGTNCYIQIFLNEGSGFSACINKIDWFDHKEIHPVIARYENFKSEAQCRASILIYLLENKLITLDEVNDRLQ